MNIYFDNAATTPLRKEVISAVSEVMEACFGNPSSTHGYGRTAKTYIETARKGIAAQLDAVPFVPWGTADGCGEPIFDGIAA